MCEKEIENFEEKIFTAEELDELLKELENLIPNPKTTKGTQKLKLKKDANAPKPKLIKPRPSIPICKR